MVHLKNDDICWYLGGIRGIKVFQFEWIPSVDEASGGFG
jgi:hypothetical protein